MPDTTVPPDSGAQKASGTRVSGDRRHARGWAVRASASALARQSAGAPRPRCRGGFVSRHRYPPDRSGHRLPVEGRSVRSASGERVPCGSSPAGPDSRRRLLDSAPRYPSGRVDRQLEHVVLARNGSARRRGVDASGAEFHTAVGHLQPIGPAPAACPEHSSVPPRQQRLNQPPQFIRSDPRRRLTAFPTQMYGQRGRQPHDQWLIPRASQWTPPEGRHEIAASGHALWQSRCCPRGFPEPDAPCAQRAREMS